MEIVTIECAGCGIMFEKRKAEWTRRRKKGHMSFFCTQACQTRVSNRSPRRKHKSKNLRADNRRDELTPFRWFVARARSRPKESNIDAAYLKRLWYRQNGKCPFTGWDLILPKSTSGWETASPRNASLDRINGSKGYVKRNLRFVAVMANIARGSFSDVQLVDFCHAVAQYWFDSERVHQGDLHG